MGCWPRSTAEKLDALIAPRVSPAWLTDHVLGDHFVGAGYGMPAVAGTPSLTVPIGESHGLPLGVTFMGRAYSEADLLAMGFAFEQATKLRTPPAFKPTLGSQPRQLGPVLSAAHLADVSGVGSGWPAVSPRPASVGSRTPPPSAPQNTHRRFPALRRTRCARRAA